MPTPTDPKNAKGKPHATTEDQIAEMESEGQAQSGAASGVADESTDQDIDTAGTEADDYSVITATNRNRKGQQLETPGDTDSADIVGPTGEQMPVQNHHGVEDSRDASPTPRKSR